MQDIFYSTFALAAFAILGLWWVVVADRRRGWAALPYRRRQAYSVSLYFTLTGIMGLVSLIAAEGGHTAVWRLAFGIAAGLGALETVLSLVRSRSEPLREGRVQVLLWLTLPLYLVVLAVAIHPTLASDIGIELKPLETEAIVVSLLFLLGINYAWLLFMEPEYPGNEREH